MEIKTRSGMNRPILEVLAKSDDAMHRKLIIQAVGEQPELSSHQWKRKVYNNGGTRFDNEVGLALSDLSIRGLIERPDRGYYKINTYGREALGRHLIP